MGRSRDEVSERPSLLFVSRRPPVPLTNGARIRTHRLATGLSHAFETTFLTFDHHPRSGDGGCARAELTSVLPEIDIVTVAGCGPGRRKPQLRSVPTRSSWTFGRYLMPAFRTTMLSIVASRKIAIVHFDDLGAALHGPIEGVFNAYSAPDVEQAIVAQTVQSTSGLRRAFAMVESRKVSREENRVWREMDLCLAVSQDDADTMLQNGARSVQLCPNGTDDVDPLPLQPLSPREPLRVLFVGSGGYLPYRRGIAWFVHQVMPKFAPGEIELDIVGARPRNPETGAGVTYHGNVDELTPWYLRSHVVIVPVFEGSGTRLKVLEAAAFGRPIISTPLGAQGLPVTPNVHYLCRSEAEGFAEALREVRSAYECPSRHLTEQLVNARAAISSYFWPKITDCLVTTYLHACATHAT